MTKRKSELPTTAGFLSDADHADEENFEELEAGDRPDAGSYDYWQKRAATYDQDIFRSSDEDHEGLIHGEIDAAAQRAEHGRRLGKGHDEGTAASKLVAVDAGCGPGLWLDALSKRFGRVVGLDQSPNLLDKAKEDKEELLHSKHAKVELHPAVDLGQPCAREYAPDGQELCGPSVPGTAHSADLVASFNVLLSPNKQARENILRREVEMLRPAPGSTLLLLVPSAESYRSVRKLYRKLGGVESGLGRYVDYLDDHPDEEADNVFRVFALTKHYTKKEACSMVEAAGLECDKVLSFPMRWRFVFPFASDEAYDTLAKQPPAHEWIVVAHPKVGAAGGSLWSRARSDFL
ncbi:unnamed protein product [Symbiodinium natans]|uniref:Methyltransferase domain-containing protein n=1 Tax=Symbiodinium natans TaxID=878477 RepID=A0A812R349_9DINO|nr:unnamed protein product [Symbiodinium natans]